MGALSQAFDEASKASPIPQEERKSLSEEFDTAVKRADEKPKEVPKPVLKSVDQPGRLASFGAGAGEAVGRGVMGVQQILGKGLSAAGGLTDIEALKQAGGWLESDAAKGAVNLAEQNAPYRQANPKSNFAGEVTGFIGSPVNKLVPGGGGATSVVGAAVKGGLQGAALNTLTSPVEEGTPFLPEKARQAGVGLLGGGVGGVLGYGLGKALGAGMEGIKALTNRLSAGDSGKAADTLVGQALANQGLTAAQVAKDRPELFGGLKNIVEDSIKSGKTVDPAAVQRLTQAQTLPVPVPMLKGQITRDPMQFSMEQNLRGIKGIGEPLTQTLTAQNRALIQNLNSFGASKGTDIVSAAKPVIETLQAADKAANAEVSQAYKAFKDATGKSLEVPLPTIASDYAKTLNEFGEAIPSQIRSKFEALGKMQWDARFTIEEAEGLIKSINRNYDPANRVQARALDELRGGIQRAISEGAGASAEGTAAAGLAKAARQAASARFQAIDSTPGLKAAIHGEEPDRFIQKFILQGNEKEIGNVVSILRKSDPSSLEALQNSIMSHIKNQVLNGRSEENGAFSEAVLKQFTNNPNMAARLNQVLGPEKMASLKQLQAVAENAIYAPVASAVNKSNTASAGANLVRSEAEGGAMNELLNVGKKIPGIDVLLRLTEAQKGVESKRLGDLVNEAVNPSVGKNSSMKLGDLVSPGARAGVAVAEERKRKSAQQ